MQLRDIDDEVKRHLMILLLTVPKQKEEVGNIVPLNYEDALQMGARDIEMVREDLHAYVDQLAEEYNIQ